MRRLCNRRVRARRVPGEEGGPREGERGEGAGPGRDERGAAAPTLAWPGEGAGGCFFGAAAEVGSAASVKSGPRVPLVPVSPFSSLSPRRPRPLSSHPAPHPARDEAGSKNVLV